MNRSFRPKRDKFGLYCYTASQGRGKTYSLIEYLWDNKDTIYCFSNVKNIHIEGLEIEFFTGFKEMNMIKREIDNLDSPIHDKIGDKQIVFVFDELFSELLKQSKIDKETMDFLSQMRKRKIILLTTSQVWAELPLTWRRMCRYQINVNMIPILTFGILWKEFQDAENMKWDEHEQDFVAPLVSNTISLCRLKVANCYNTYERIRS